MRVTVDRHSVAETPELITDEVEKARREAENGVRQYQVALEMIRGHIHDPERPFRLRQSTILQLHETALRGIHPLAGTFRNTPVSIGQSKHTPPAALHVSDEVSDLCEYVNQNWATASAVHLAAYVLWKLNWIHPFADGNGRTSRAISYVVMSIKLDSLLPGTPTIPEQIASAKSPYYEALEEADLHWTKDAVDVSALEGMLASMLAKQLLHAANEASGQT
ncbi:Fic family protein [Methylobacterium sp. J-068]|uniref:Fic family protein n=1 Tax=Methylobacterium sp. J-068 TaxID=2836649 RepID=UPI001FBADD8B|nr:Fic family protein [Methylobacterium sp. J-068]MCJ2036728.1 Fic family protein [Methylobacterium sp. J-068]